MSMSVNSVISSYTYTYQNKLRPRLDKNDDAAWDRQEVENYARDYQQATGNSINVNNLYEQYDSDSDGVFNATEYEAIISADALGMDTLSRLRVEQQTSTGTANTDKPDAAALNKLIEDFAYKYSGKLTPNFDSDQDGVWSREELNKYADAYQKATGKTLDVDKIMETYDTNGNGVLSYSEQETAKKADAFGMDSLLSLQASLNGTSNSGSSSTSTAGTDKPDAAALNKLIKDFAYKYSGKLTPNFDSDQDGVWNREELDKYAAAYQKATGKTLDVDKIMETYDTNGNGALSYSEQEAAKKADAFGMDSLLSLQASLNGTSGTGGSSSTSSTGGSGIKVDRYDLNSFIANNTYSYGSKLRLSSKAIDTNGDGTWNRDELTAYADAYQKVTGSKIDVDYIMKNYADSDGNISFKNQLAIQDNDLLGLGRLATLRDEAKAQYEREALEARKLINQKTPSATKANNGSKSLEDWINTLNATQKSALSRITFFSEQNNFLLNSMVGGNSAMFAFNNLASQYNSVKMYSSVSNGQNWNQISGSMINSLV